MAPLRPHAEEEVRAALATLPVGPESPFGRVASTHFARLLLVGALLGGDGEPAEPAQSYLLFTADFDGSLEDWCSAVAEGIGAEVESVFKHCDGYLGREQGAFLDFINAYRIDVGFSVHSYRATVATIRESLELRRALREFAVASQGLAPGELRSAWRERFGG